MNIRMLSMLLLMATAVAAKTPTTHQKMTALCDFSETSMPSSPSLCADPRRLEAASNAELLSAMDEFWNHWRSPTGVSIKAAFETRLLANYPLPPHVYSQSELQAAPTGKLCSLLRGNDAANPLAADELTRRNALTSDEIRLVRLHRLSIGMSETGVTCSWGEPSRRDRTVTPTGELIQWIYGGRTQVDTVNGVVTAFRE